MRLLRVDAGESKTGPAMLIGIDEGGDAGIESESNRLREFDITDVCTMIHMKINVDSLCQSPPNYAV